MTKARFVHLTLRISRLFPRWVSLLVVTFVPILAFLPLLKALGPGAAYGLFILPVMVAGGTFGVTAGISAGLLYIPIGLVLSHFAFPGRRIMIENVSTGVLFSFFGGALGYVRVLKQRVQFELTRRIQLQTSLIETSKFISLGQMAGGLAHEINNPLAVIMGKIYQLRKGARNESVDLKAVLEAVTIIEKSADRISKIVIALRSFSGETTLDRFETVPLETLVDQILLFFFNRFATHQIRFELEPSVGATLIPCRPGLIQQILMHLFSNSLDAVMEQKVRWIKLDVRSQDDFFEISVTDSGQGIATEHQPRLMEPFFTTKEIGKGNGLGLSVSKGLIESQGGTLTLDLKSPHTRFLIRLPKNPRDSLKLSA